MIDYAAVLADCAKKHAALGQVIDGLVALLPEPEAPPVPSADVEVAPPPKRIAAPKKVKKAAKRRTTPHQTSPHRTTKAASTELLKGIIAREGLRAAATATGISYQTLYGRAKREGWKVADCRGKRPKPSVAARVARAVAPIAASTAKSPIAKSRGKGAVSNCELRRCAKCEQYTTMDPCERCHAPWKRTDG